MAVHIQSSMSTVFCACVSYFVSYCMNGYVTTSEIKIRAELFNA